MRKGKKPGPKFKIGPLQEKEIMSAVTLGGSLEDAAGYIGVNYSTLYRRRKTDAGFADRLLQAEKKGKLHHLNKIAKAAQWQASAWFLARKHAKEFGDVLRHTGHDGGAIGVDVNVKVKLDAKACADEFEAFSRQRMGGEVLSADGDGESVPESEN